MTKPATSLISAAIATFVMTASCQAAYLEYLQGKISVDVGAGFKPVVRPAVLKTGDRVMADAGSSAVLIYSNGCVNDVRPGAVVTVVDVSNCVMRVQSDVGGSLKDGTAPNPIVESRRIDMRVVVAATAVIGALALVVKHDPSPSSP